MAGSTAGQTVADTETSLCAELDAWCKQHGIQPRSADDILADWDALTPEQREYLERFIARWNAYFSQWGDAL